MTGTKLVAAALLCLAGWAASAKAAVVVVTFVHPEQYRDATRTGGPVTSAAREPALAELARHLERLGERRLPAGQTLRIDILDVDLAGEIDPLRRSTPQIRVMRAGTWPRIRLRYTLEEGGAVLRRGEESIADRDYQSHASTIGAGDALRYEKAMLEDWFMQRFARAPR